MCWCERPSRHKDPILHRALSLGNKPRTICIMEESSAGQWEFLMISVIKVALFFSSKAVLHMRFHSRHDKLCTLTMKTPLLPLSIKSFKHLSRKFPWRIFFYCNVIAVLTETCWIFFQYIRKVLRSPFPKEHSKSLSPPRHWPQEWEAHMTYYHLYTK